MGTEPKYIYKTGKTYKHTDFNIISAPYISIEHIESLSFETHVVSFNFTVW